MLLRHFKFNYRTTIGYRNLRIILIANMAYIHIMYTCICLIFKCSLQRRRGGDYRLMWTSGRNGVGQGDVTVAVGEGGRVHAAPCCQRHQCSGIGMVH